MTGEPMPLPVQLKAVIDALDIGMGDLQSYINPKTGEIASFGDDAPHSGASR